MELQCEMMENTKSSMITTSVGVNQPNFQCIFSVPIDDLIQMAIRNEENFGEELRARNDSLAIGRIHKSETKQNKTKPNRHE